MQLFKNASIVTNEFAPDMQIICWKYGMNPIDINKTIQIFHKIRFLNKNQYVIV